MTAKKTAEAAEKATEPVTIYHPDPNVPAAIRSREVPADMLKRWQAQGWLTQEERDARDSSN